MSFRRRLIQIATGQRRDRQVSPAERAQREAAELAERQRRAIERASEQSPAKLAPPAPKRPGIAAPSTPALPGGSAPVIQTILTPAGKLAEHDWQVLRPAELSPYFNQLDEATIRELMNEADEVVGDGDAAVLRYMAPTYAVEDKLHYELNRRYYTTLAVKKWPSDENPFSPHSWRGLMVRHPYLTISLHHWRVDTQSAEKDLTEERDRIEVELISAREGKGKPKSQAELSELKERLASIEHELQRVIGGRQTLFHVSVYFRVGGDSLEELARNVESVREWARGASVTLTELPGDQRRAMISSLPYSADPANGTIRLTSRRAARIFPAINRPYADRDSEGNPRGVLYGIHMGDFSPVLMTPWNNDGTTQITTVLGDRGGGKTFWTRLHIGRLAMTGARVLAVDPMGNSFTRWFRNNSGQVLTIGPGSGTYVNPLKREVELDAETGQERIEPIATKTSRLMLLFSLLLGDQWDNRREDLLATALDSWYNSFPATEERLMPDFLEHLRGMKTYRSGEPLSAPQIHLLNELYDALRVACLERGDLRDFFTHPTNIDLSGNRIVFNLGNTTEGRVQIFAIYMAVTLAINEARRDSRKTLLVVDEIHRLFDAAGEVAALDKWINDLVRTSRHWQTAITFITQFFDEDEKKLNRGKESLIKASNTFVLMRATEPMLAQTAALRESFDYDRMVQLLKIDPEALQADRSTARPMLIYREDRPIPAYSVALEHERNEDDTYHRPDA